MEIIKFWEHVNVPVSQAELNVVLIAHVREPRGHMNIRQLQYFVDLSETLNFTKTPGQLVLDFLKIAEAGGLY